LNIDSCLYLVDQVLYGRFIRIIVVMLMLLISILISNID